MISALYPHDDSCKNKALLYLLKTDKVNMRQNTAAPPQNNNIHDDMIRTITSLSTSSLSRAKQVKSYWKETSLFCNHCFSRNRSPFSGKKRWTILISYAFLWGMIWALFCRQVPASKGRTLVYKKVAGGDATPVGDAIAKWLRQSFRKHSWKNWEIVLTSSGRLKCLPWSMAIDADSFEGQTESEGRSGKFWYFLYCQTFVCLICHWLLSDGELRGRSEMGWDGGGCKKVIGLLGEDWWTEEGGAV